jgi:hypothetical protein
MNTYPTSNAQAQMTHALWDAADVCPDYEEDERVPTKQGWKRCPVCDCECDHFSGFVNGLCPECARDCDELEEWEVGERMRREGEQETEDEEGAIEP